eukprot:s1295_g16.t1
MSTIPGAAARHCEALQSEAPAGLRPAPLGRECWRWEPRSGRHFPGRRPKKAHAFEILRAAGREKKRALLKFTDVRGASEVPNWCWTVLSVRDFWSPLASAKARKQVMKRRADVELVVGLVMLTGVFLFVCAPITVILFWNFMMMRYMMSTWTQDSFQRLDGLLSPVLTSVPGVKQAYQALQAWLYSFVDPNSKSAGKLCTIL